MFLIIIHSVSTLVSFSIILWGLSGGLSLFYMVILISMVIFFWVAIFLGKINVWAVFRVVKPLKNFYIVSRNMKQILDMVCQWLETIKTRFMITSLKKENMFYQGRILIRLLIIFTKLLSVRQRSILSEVFLFKYIL